ncbi:MAG TPA: nickel pincer cofactor biosynthesis protein LarC [Methanospirillum sp.]|uniref:nickel pincer cofactor biosynthesis protein LarC n=1 Tax=Methanospirillum sp. TaxID=45200 RepID=UPI002CF00A79|nr:nickel pincer cofactor biosynthesis protein LarC [Methanospirillum sp.]HWQ64598.1 nickel pincer cofactor biosynthesis protein LarC [Methanospirillum sp.]
MRILAIDPFHGAAGDMFLGALLGLGADRDAVIRVMETVVATPTIEVVSRAGIQSIKIHTHAGPASRTLEEVIARVRSSSAPAVVIARAEAVFQRIASAEQSIHGRKEHFHEVGADDAIADVLGSCMAMHTISPDLVKVFPVATGTGTVRMEHGMYPVPAPATAAILAAGGLQVILGGGNGELCTPTGAALLTEFSSGIHSLPPARLDVTGYGAGDRDDPHTPNVLRMMLLTVPEEPGGDEVDILETNVDDVPGEVIGYLLEKLMEKGARDASATPLTMKKGRPGHLIRVICRPDDAERLSILMARETGTLGVRCIPAVHRFIADRRIEEIDITINDISGKFPVKYGIIEGSCYTLKAEYEHVCRFAREHNLPVTQVMRTVEEAAWKKVHQRQDFHQ